MRSRYSAYCCKNIEYIYQTQLPAHQQNSLQQQATLKDQIAEFANAVHFVGLTITAWSATNCSDTDRSENVASQPGNEGSVSFVARYISGNKLESLAEKSRFVFNGQWYYSEGRFISAPAQTIGRNDACPCGSGKKFKHCNLHLASGTVSTHQGKA
ncbi:YchJ family protein [Arsukibacterium sp.]|uniref:YchJ family protein n=1 Tax=Arsukibacterium sp. TaxID=1977258 RepID=UPI00299E1690|nr:YchJ family metal-binding protein [Arsukibacterium sp.]MDX1538640.1 YchJ family metal-binding protein [Arsukibacterium sp.]